MTDTPPDTPEHDHHLAHHFETPQQQYQSGKLGIWLFLATEILLFSGLFCAYAVYRANHPEVFYYAHLYLSKPLGALNTMVLIFSSFTMASAVRAAQLGKTRSLVALLGVTLVCGFAFLGVKAVEYQDKWKEGLLAGTSYHPETPPPGAVVPKPAKPPAAVPPAAKPSVPPSDRTTIAPAAVGPRGISQEWLTKKPPPVWSGPAPYNVQVFFGIYFAMTGLHGVHVLAGMGAIAWVLTRARRHEFGPAYFTPVDFTGLYWHLVDVIWIFLFPLLYLIA
jgi:cytochrome c oxidase subunit III